MTTFFKKPSEPFFSNFRPNFSRDQAALVLEEVYNNFKIEASAELLPKKPANSK